MGLNETPMTLQTPQASLKKSIYRMDIYIDFWQEVLVEVTLITTQRWHLHLVLKLRQTRDHWTSFESWHGILCWRTKIERRQFWNFCEEAWDCPFELDSCLPSAYTSILNWCKLKYNWHRMFFPLLSLQQEKYNMPCYFWLYHKHISLFKEHDSMDYCKQFI